MASVIVVPSVEELSSCRRKNVPCPAQGCTRVFCQGAALRLHMVKVHHIIESDEDLALLHGTPKSKQTENKCFHCPVEGCKYNRRLGRWFTSMALLKQHYIHCHAEKKFKCSRCGTGYPQQRDLDRHAKNCQLMFVCAQCKKVYNFREALVTHCRREGHKSKFEGINREAFAQQESTTEGSQDINTSPAVNKVRPSSDNQVKITFITQDQAQKLQGNIPPSHVASTMVTSKTLSPASAASIVGRRHLVASSRSPQTVKISLLGQPKPGSILKSAVHNSGIQLCDLQNKLTLASGSSNGHLQKAISLVYQTSNNSRTESSPLASQVANNAKQVATHITNVTQNYAADNVIGLSRTTPPLVDRAMLPSTSNVLHSGLNGLNLNQQQAIVVPSEKLPSALGGLSKQLVHDCVHSTNDPKSMVMGLLKSDLFKNWSCYVRAGVGPAQAFQAVSDSLNKSSVFETPDAVPAVLADQGGIDKDAMAEKMMKEIKNLQLKTDFLSLLQENDVGESESQLKEQMSEILDSMKSQIKNLKDSCKSLLLKQSPTFLRQETQILSHPSKEQIAFKTKKFPPSVIRSKSKLLLPKPNILMLPVNIQSNGAISSGTPDPLVFICDTSTVPLRRNTPKPIKPKPSTVSLISALSSSSTMTDVSLSKATGQDIEMQTDCASFTSRGVGTGFTAANAVGIQTQTMTLGSQTYDLALSEQAGVNIGVQTSSMSKQITASGTQTQAPIVGVSNHMFNDRYQAKVPPRRRMVNSGTGNSMIPCPQPPTAANVEKSRKRKDLFIHPGQVCEGTTTKHRKKHHKGIKNRTNVLNSDKNIAIGSPILLPEYSLQRGTDISRDENRTSSTNTTCNLQIPQGRDAITGMVGRQSTSNASSNLSPGSLSIETETGKMNGVVPGQGISVGTMPSPSFMSSPGIALGAGSMGTGSMGTSPMGTTTMGTSPMGTSSMGTSSMGTSPMGTRGTDPLPGFSGAPIDDNDSLALFSSQYTQTSLWKEIEESIMAESNATQTMESFLTDSNLQAASLALPTLMESGVQASNAQHIETQTLCDDVPFSQSKSIGVGTGLLDDTSPLLDGFSRSVGIDTQLFDDLFPEVSSRSVAISTPLFDGLNPHGEGTSVGTSTFSSIDQTSVSVGASPPRAMFSDAAHSPPVPPQRGQATDFTHANFSPTSSSTTPTLRYESIATASVQTDTDRELRGFLTSGSQTREFDPSYINMETQTVDDMYNQLLSNMETQTTDAFLAGLGFVDIETQTSAPNQDSASVETQTAQLLSPPPAPVSHDQSFSVTPSASATIHEMNSRSQNSTNRTVSVSIGTETQTILPTLHITDNCLTDSHTQTTINEFGSLVDQFEKN